MINKLKRGKLARWLVKQHLATYMSKFTDYFSNLQGKAINFAYIRQDMDSYANAGMLKIRSLSDDVLLDKISITEMTSKLENIDSDRAGSIDFLHNMNDRRVKSICKLSQRNTYLKFDTNNWSLGRFENKILNSLEEANRQYTLYVFKDFLNYAHTSRLNDTVSFSGLVSLETMRNKSNRYNGFVFYVPKYRNVNLDRSFGPMYCMVLYERLGSVRLHMFPCKSAWHVGGNGVMALPNSHDHTDNYSLWRLCAICPHARAIEGSLCMGQTGEAIKNCFQSGDISMAISSVLQGLISSDVDGGYYGIESWVDDCDGGIRDFTGAFSTPKAFIQNSPWLRAKFNAIMIAKCTRCAKYLPLNSLRITINGSSKRICPKCAVYCHICNTAFKNPITINGSPVMGALDVSHGLAKCVKCKNFVCGYALHDFDVQSSSCSIKIGNEAIVNEDNTTVICIKCDKN